MPILIVILFCMVSFDVAASEAETSIPTLTPEQLENYQFQANQEEAESITVKDLTIGQIEIMNKQRRTAKDLLARQLGIVNFTGAKRDLASLQQLVDRRILRDNQIEEWQAIGVLFGDILAREFRLTWVNYEDDLGSSKALRYRKTDNFVFPVTLFSKRLRFGEKIDMNEIYAKLEAEINEFIAWESKPKLPMGKNSR